MYFLCWVVRVDPELLVTCPTIDHFQVISKAILLCTVGGIALFSWGGFFGQFWPFYYAVPVTALMMVWIVVMDQTMGAARWALQGVLAVPGKARFFGLSAALLLRVVMGGVTAWATSYSATMLMCHATIEAQLQKDRDDANAAKRASGTAEKAELWQSILGARDAEVKRAEADIRSIGEELDARRRTRDRASQQVADNKIKADCEISGGAGCHAGFGPQARAALTLQAKAVDDQRRAEADIPGLEARLAAAERNRAAAAAAFGAREGEYLEAAKAIDKRVVDEAVPERNDPVTSFLALQRVFHSPAGEAARFYAHLMLGLLLMVEVSYVVVSEYFEHASVYKARLIARTKIMGAGEGERYRRTTVEMFPPDRADDKTVFRIVPRFESKDSTAASGDAEMHRDDAEFEAVGEEPDARRGTRDSSSGQSGERQDSRSHRPPV
jgi:hypothetical protein